MAPLLLLLLGVGTVALVAGASTKGSGGGKKPILAPGKGGLAVATAADAEADALYDTTLARWAAYETALGGKPVPGVASAVAAVDEASANVRADIDARVATGKKNEAAFLSAVGFFFGDTGKSYFQKVIDFAKSITGVSECETEEVHAQAQACAAEYLSLGAPIEFMSSALAAFYFSNYCQLRGWFCGMRDDFLLQTAARQSALRALSQTMITKAPDPKVAQVIRFSLDGLVQDLGVETGFPGRTNPGGNPAVDAARRIAGPYRYEPAYHAAHPIYGETYDSSDQAWAVAAVRLAVAQYGGDERKIFRAVFQETKDRVWQYSVEFPGEVLSRLKGLAAMTYSYGAGEHHVANPPGGRTAVRAEWARLAYLAAQGKNIRGAANSLIIPVGYNVGVAAGGGGITLGQ